MKNLSVIVVITLFFGISAQANAIPMTFNCQGEKTQMELGGISFRGNFFVNRGSFAVGSEKIPLPENYGSVEGHFLVEFSGGNLEFVVDAIDSIRSYEAFQADGQFLDSGSCHRE